MCDHDIFEIVYEEPRFNMIDKAIDFDIELDEFEIFKKCLSCGKKLGHKSLINLNSEQLSKIHEILS